MIHFKNSNNKERRVDDNYWQLIYLIEQHDSYSIMQIVVHIIRKDEGKIQPKV